MHLLLNNLSITQDKPECTLTHVSGVRFTRHWNTHEVLMAPLTCSLDKALSWITGPRTESEETHCLYFVTGPLQTVLCRIFKFESRWFVCYIIEHGGKHFFVSYILNQYLDAPNEDQDARAVQRACSSAKNCKLFKAWLKTPEETWTDCNTTPK